MLDDFFVRAVLAGCIIALIAGPFGCILVWRRMAFFGDALAHSALMGVAMAFLFQLNLTLSIMIVGAIVSFNLLLLQRQKVFGSDAILAMLSHVLLALGLVGIALMGNARLNLNNILFGDILSVSRFDIVVIGLLGVGLLIGLYSIWRAIFAITVDEHLSIAEGIDVGRVNLVFMLMLSLLVAVCLKLVGVLLVTALLIIPALAVRPFSPHPEAMAGLSSLAGAAAVIIGLLASLHLDTPSGPSIVVAAGGVFALLFFTSWILRRQRQ